MKNYSLVKKLSSSFGLISLSSSIISGLSTENAFAASGKFLKSLFFSRVCDCISEEDLKNYYKNFDAFWNEQKKEASENLNRLRHLELGKLFRIWKFANINTKDEFQKDKNIRELALKLREDVELILTELNYSDFDSRLTQYFRSEEFIAKVGMIFKEDIDAKRVDEKTLKEIFSSKDAATLYSGKNGSRDSEKEKKYPEIIWKVIIGKYFVNVPKWECSDLLKKVLGAKTNVENAVVVPSI